MIKLQRPACSKSIKVLCLGILPVTITYSVFEENMECHRGSNNGWHVIAESVEEGVEDGVFSLELACELIGLTPQASGVGVIFAVKYEEV